MSTTKSVMALLKEQDGQLKLADGIVLRHSVFFDRLYMSKPEEALDVDFHLVKTERTVSYRIQARDYEGIMEEVKAGLADYLEQTGNRVMNRVMHS